MARKSPLSASLAWTAATGAARNCRGITASRKRPISIWAGRICSTGASAAAGARKSSCAPATRSPIRVPERNTLEPTIRVWFSSQQLTTEDPEIQFLIETKGDQTIAWGEEGRKAWQRIYLTQEQQKDVANAELESINKQIRDQNALLADVQSRTKNKAPAAQAS